MIKEKVILPIRDHVLALRDRIPELPGLRFAGECIRKYQWVGIFLLIAALGRQNGRAAAAAEALKLPRKTFYDKLARYGIRPEDYRR